MNLFSTTINQSIYLFSNPKKGHGNQPLRYKRICIYSFMIQSLL